MILTVMGWTLARAMAVAVAAVVSGWLVQQAMADPNRTRRRWVWVLMLIPLFTPSLVVGYAYSSFSLSLIHQPAWNTVLYAVLVWLKFTPVAALALHVAPRDVSDAGMHCYRMIFPVGRDRRKRRGVDLRGGPTGVPQVSEDDEGSRTSSVSRLGNLRHSRLGSLRYEWGRFGFWMRGPGRPVVLAFALVFLLAFGEFEMASLMLVSSWTVMLFDAQVGGMELMASLRMAAGPMLVELAVFGGSVIWMTRSRGGFSRVTQTGVASKRGVQGAAWSVLVCATGLVTAVPAGIVMRGLLTGWGGVWVIQRELLVSIGFAGVSAMLAMWAARRLLRHGGRWRVMASSVPGLMGPLLTALILVWVFQLPIARWVYDTPVPLLTGLVVLMMPVAVLLMLLMRVDRRTSAVHVARLMGESGAVDVRSHAIMLRWVLSTRRMLWAGLLLFFWAYFDVTASHLLAPVGMTPVTVRLYNQMHYGQMAVLSAMVGVAVLAPVGLALVALALGRFWMTRR